MTTLLALAIMLLVPAAPENENPWARQVADAAARAGRTRSVADYGHALDVAWRADDWQAGLRLAQEVLKQHAGAEKLHGPVARALWRAGEIAEAERVAAKIPAATRDRVALGVLITTHAARGEEPAALAAAERLEKQRELTAEDLFHVIGTRWSQDRLAGMPDLLRRAEKLTDAAHGYPEIYLADQLRGLPEFFEAVGTDPLNQVIRHGSAPMPVIRLVNLPSCEVTINGHGPYRLVVDTGGSIMLSLDDAVAEEVGLRIIAPSSVHGVTGKQDAGQALVDELALGSIRCRRVMTRVFGVRRATAYTADGILGTGIFGERRLALDFLNGKLAVSASGAAAGPGQALEARIVGDAKVIVLHKMAGEPAVGLLDTGADVFAVSPSRLARIFPDENIQTVTIPALGVGGGDPAGLNLAPGVRFELGGRVFEKFGGIGLDVLDKLLGPLVGVQTDVLIGMTVMREMRTLTVDYPRCRAWVEWLPED